MTHTYDNFLPNLKEASANLIVVLFIFKLQSNFFHFMFNYQTFVQKRSKIVIFSIIGIVSACTIPILYPHVYHGTHIYHLALHVAGIILSLIMATLSINSFFMHRAKKMIVVSSAFLMFTAAELVQLLEAEKTHIHNFWESPTEISHIMLFGMLVLFAIAIFKRN